MLYVSKEINKDMVEITDTTTNRGLVESKNCLYSKYRQKIVEGLTFSPKRKKPIIEVTTPVLLMLDRIPVGQVILLRRNQDNGFEHCIKLEQNKGSFKFYNGGGSAGFFVLTRNMFLQYNNVIALDVVHVNDCVAKALKKDYKAFMNNKA